MTIIVKTLKVEPNDTLEYKANPKRPGFAAHERYEIYRMATNLDTLEALCEENEVRGEPLRKKMRADLNYDFEHGHLLILKEDEGVVYTFDKEAGKAVPVDA